MTPPALAVHDCLSCGQRACHRHDPDTALAQVPTAWLVDQPSPEFAALYEARRGAEDVLHLATRRFGDSRHGWPRIGAERHADGAALRRSLALRSARTGTPRARILLAADARLAAAHARRLSPLHARVVVAQALLPHLWLGGVLHGRSVEVLMDRMPMEALHRVLDAARDRHPDSPTLGDFRAPEHLVRAEREALGAARRLITPHHGIAAAFPVGRVALLDWSLPPPLPTRRGGRTVLFAGPALARKGAYAMRAAMADLSIDLVVARQATEGPGFWGDLPVRELAKGAMPDTLAAVVLPALVEHQPTLLLRALGAGIPVIASAACGLSPQAGLTVVPADDAGALRNALMHVLSD